MCALKGTPQSEEGAHSAQIPLTVFAEFERPSPLVPTCCSLDVAGTCPQVSAIILMLASSAGAGSSNSVHTSQLKVCRCSPCSVPCSDTLSSKLMRQRFQRLRVEAGATEQASRSVDVGHESVMSGSGVKIGNVFTRLRKKIHLENHAREIRPLQRKVAATRGAAPCASAGDAPVAKAACSVHKVAT